MMPSQHADITGLKPKYRQASILVLVSAGEVCGTAISAFGRNHAALLYNHTLLSYAHP